MMLPLPLAREASRAWTGAAVPELQLLESLDIVQLPVLLLPLDDIELLALQSNICSILLGMAISPDMGRGVTIKPRSRR